MGKEEEKRRRREISRKQEHREYNAQCQSTTFGVILINIALAITIYVIVMGGLMFTEIEYNPIGLINDAIIGNSVCGFTGGWIALMFVAFALVATYSILYIGICFFGALVCPFILCGCIGIAGILMFIFLTSREVYINEYESKWEDYVDDNIYPDVTCNDPYSRVLYDGLYNTTGTDCTHFNKPGFNEYLTICCAKYDNVCDELDGSLQTYYISFGVGIAVTVCLFIVGGLSFVHNFIYCAKCHSVRTIYETKDDDREKALEMT